MSLPAYTSETNNLKLQECLQQMEFTVITTTILYSQTLLIQTLGPQKVLVLKGCLC